MNQDNLFLNMWNTHKCQHLITIVVMWKWLIYFIIPPRIYDVCIIFHLYSYMVQHDLSELVGLLYPMIYNNMAYNKEEEGSSF